MTNELVGGEKLAQTFVDSSYEVAKRARVDISYVIVMVLKDMLGETGAYAVIYILRKESLEDPRKFADGIGKIFGMAGGIILERLLSEYQRFVPQIIEAQEQLT